MARYIDAEELFMDNAYEWFDDWGNYTSAGKAIVDAPTADVVEVVHGEWIRQDETFTRFMCSECGSKNHNIRWVFCPNCGAKMDGKKVE